MFKALDRASDGGSSRLSVPSVMIMGGYGELEVQCSPEAFADPLILMNDVIHSAEMLAILAFCTAPKCPLLGVKRTSGSDLPKPRQMAFPHSQNAWNWSTLGEQFTSIGEGLP